MTQSPFSLGYTNAVEASEAESYLRAKFAKAKAKAKVKAGVKGGSTAARPLGDATYRTGASATTSGKCSRASAENGGLGGAPHQPGQDDLDDAERELLGLSRSTPVVRSSPPDGSAAQPSDTEGVESTNFGGSSERGEPSSGRVPLQLQAGPAMRLAAIGTEQTSRRTCSEGHSVARYAVGRSAAICDRCDFLQKPGEIVFGCRTCDSELCVSCALETATSPEDAKDDLEVIAQVAKALGRGGSGGTRFVGTPSGAVLDMAPAHDAKESAAGMREETASKRSHFPDPLVGQASPGPGRFPRPKQANEAWALVTLGSWLSLETYVDESQWKHRLEPGNLLGDQACHENASLVRSPSANGGRDLLGQMLAEQERIIQQRRLDRREDREASSAWSSSRATAEPSMRAGAAHPSAGSTASAKTVEPEEDSHNLMDENAARHRPAWALEATSSSSSGKDVVHHQDKLTMVSEPMERTFDLTLTLTGDFVDELARGYRQPWFQELVRKCAEDCGHERMVFLERLQDIAHQVQLPILENWGFEGDEQGLYDMTSILLEHSAPHGDDADGAPTWLTEKIRQCLTLLYGGSESGMLRGANIAEAALATPAVMREEQL
ncbi:unnamed protein product [Polarella glacialis]|uniref:Protein C10 n=1 Tax=Polarella glacialis TaxID=89957 RepID=A0A813JNF4_POLGL|nr:unnamed protein product [Polarella glacialis]